MKSLIKNDMNNIATSMSSSFTRSGMKSTTNNLVTMKKVKLLQYLKMNGYAGSNREVKKLIRDGKVIVNGYPASSCSMMISLNIDGQVIVLKKHDDTSNDRNCGYVGSSTCNNNTSKNHIHADSNINNNGERDNNGEKKKKRIRRLEEPDYISSLPKTEQTINNEKDIHSPNPCCIVYNKPCGMICTTSKDAFKPKHNQEEGQHETLADMAHPIPNGYHPIGRLDRHSHGLLLFSCDGRLTSALLSPRSCIPRIYEIIVRGDVGLVDSKRYHDIIRYVENGAQTDYGFFQGIIKGTMKRNVGYLGYEHQKCGNDSGGNRNDTYGQSPEEYQKLQAQSMEDKCGNSTAVNPLLEDEILSMIQVEVREGKKRMVRRLFASLGLFVLDLQRISYGDIHIGEVSKGNWRYITKEELIYCKNVMSSWTKAGAG